MVQVIRRNPDGTVRAIEGAPVKNAASGLGKVKTLGAVLAGGVKIGDLTKKQRQQLAKIKLDKLDYNKKDLAKLGLTKKQITVEDFDAIKAQLGGVTADGKVKKPELKGLKEFVGKTVSERELATLEEKAGIDSAAIQAEQRGRIARLNMSIFARQAVQRARGVRGAIGTSMGGSSGFGQGLARVNIGGM